MKSLPGILLISRLVIAVVIMILALLFEGQNGILVVSLMYLGIISDAFDGIIARKQNISTDTLRTQDTLIDLLFYIAILIYIYTADPQLITTNRYLIITISMLELVMYLVSLLRFRKLPSPHAILSKFWGIYLIVEFTLLILGIKGLHFQVALSIGVFVHLDRMAIYCLIRNWDRDIPSSYHAYLLRQGKSIKRKALFN